MDLSGVIVVILGMLVFFGGAVWLGILSRKNNRPVGQGVKPARPIVSTARAKNRRLERKENPIDA